MSGISLAKLMLIRGELAAVAMENVMMKKRYAVIEFQRPLVLPRFSIKKGERWSFLVTGKLLDRIEAIQRGDEFEFGGGQVQAQDVKIIYDGPGCRRYVLLAGRLNVPESLKASAA